MHDQDETLFRNGRFLDPAEGSEPPGDALLARGGRIVHVGREVDCRAQAAPSAPRVDLDGRTVLPGFVDSHVHLRSLGESLRQCDLSGARSRREAVECLAAFAEAHGDAAWVRARGYRLNDWPDPSYPTARDLDEAVADRPCIAVAFDGHSVWLNSKACAAAGLTRGAGDPDGGVIVRDGTGRPTGYLLEAAAGIGHRAVPPDSEEQRVRLLRAAIDEMVRRGHTAAHAPLARGDWSPTETVGRVRAMFPGNRCPLRIRFFVPFDRLDEVASAVAGRDERQRVRLAGIKCFIDGSLGSRTAWMFEPFLDDGDNRGMCLQAPAELRRRVEGANAAGVPLICHAIGDRACAEALRAFLDGGNPQAGNRIEHAQHLRERDVGLFARAGVAASIQPAHLWADRGATDRLLGPRRAAWTYPFRSLLDAGATLAMGSDAPVVPPSLQASLHAAVTRTDADGVPAGGWHGEQRIAPRDWAVGATHAAWRSIGEGDRLGRLAPGMACDLCVLSRDVLAESCTDFLDWHVEATVVGGEVVYRKDDAHET